LFHITDGDVLRRAAQRDRSSALRSLLAWLSGDRQHEGIEVAVAGRTAADVMTSPVVTVTPATPVVEAIRLMIAHRIKRLPVVDEQGWLVGLVGRAGVLAALSHRQDRDV
jgi:CBS domain-containing protein